MPRRNSPRDNERLRARTQAGIDTAKLMAKLRADTPTTTVGRAMARAHRKNGRA